MLETLLQDPCWSGEAPIHQRRYASGPSRATHQQFSHLLFHACASVISGKKRDKQQVKNPRVHIEKADDVFGFNKLRKVEKAEKGQ